MTITYAASPIAALWDFKVEVDMPADGFLLIGELGARANMDPKTIRFYERVGLLTPQKHGRIGVYNALDVRRLVAIKKLRQFDFSIETIRRIRHLQGDLAFTTPPVPAVLEMFASQLNVMQESRDFIDTQISDLRMCLATLQPQQKAEPESKAS